MPRCSPCRWLTPQSAIRTDVPNTKWLLVLCILMECSTCVCTIRRDFRGAIPDPGHPVGEIPVNLALTVPGVAGSIGFLVVDVTSRPLNHYPGPLAMTVLLVACSLLNAPAKICSSWAAGGVLIGYTVAYDLNVGPVWETHSAFRGHFRFRYHYGEEQADIRGRDIP